MTAQTTSLEKIIVLDFGSQYNQLITRRIREFGVFSELLHNDITAEEIKAHGNVKGIIFSGGPHSVYAEDAFTVDPAIFELGIPVLGDLLRDATDNASVRWEGRIVYNA